MSRLPSLSVGLCKDCTALFKEDCMKLTPHTPAAVLITVLVIALGSHHLRGEARALPLDDCRKIQRKIDHYTALRRGGGSSKQMESWKRKRQEYKDRFRLGNCKRHGFGIR